jgi:hypothetical protein
LQWGYVIVCIHGMGNNLQREQGGHEHKIWFGEQWALWWEELQQLALQVVGRQLVTRFDGHPWSWRCYIVDGESTWSALKNQLFRARWQEGQGRT